jgi:hypothetical protein
MSGTRRTPIRRRRTPPVSLTAVKIFREMLRCPCTCEDSPSVCGDFDERCLRRDCPGCERYWELNSHLHRELKCKPWEQAVEDPDAPNPEPAGTYNYERWRPDEGARARWRALEEGVRRLRREEREMRRARAEARQQPAPSVPNA